MIKEILSSLHSRLYSPKRYWSSRKDPNNAKGKADDIVAVDQSYIHNYVKEASSVLELGPGTGRTFGAYSPGQGIWALEITDRYRGTLERNARNNQLGLHFYELNKSDSDFPFNDKAFRVGVAAQVLMHVPPETVKHTVSELIRTCERVIVIATYTHGVSTRGPIAKQVFNHPYFELVSGLGCYMNHVFWQDGRLYFVVETELPGTYT